MSDAHVIKYLKGEQIFHVGDSANCAYIVESGEIALFSDTKEGDLIATLEKGELLGEMGVINGLDRSVSAFANTDVELLVIDSEQITMRLQNSDPIIRGVMEVLLRRIRNMLGDGDSTNSKNNIVVTEGMHKIRFEKEMFLAFDNDEIINVYQPMVSLEDGEIAGFEALSRWRHPEKGMISPFEFISLAEESDFIVPMGLKIFDSACKQLVEFQAIRDQANVGSPPLFMSINVSAAQLAAANFLNEVKKIATKYAINPSNIKIEITESMVVDYKSVQSWIDECSEFGFKLSLDDFGTGHSGFEHLLELDFHTIKIDQTFVKSMTSNPKSLILLEMITTMAQRMKMSIVAEGIEDLNSANKLKEMGVNYGQGYYFFKPMNRHDLLKIL